MKIEGGAVSFKNVKVVWANKLKLINKKLRVDKILIIILFGWFI